MSCARVPLPGSQSNLPRWPFFAAAPQRAHARAPAPDLAAWGPEVRRVLCFRPDNLGDVLMTSPAIAALKHQHPERHITLLASRAGAAAARHVPEIDEVIVFDPPWARNDGSADPERTRELVEILAARNFDAVAIFTVYSQSPLPAAMVCHLAGIERRLAYCRENPYALINDWYPEPEPLQTVRHEVQRQLDLVAAVGAHAVRQTLRFEISPQDDASLEPLLSELAPGFAMHPGLHPALHSSSQPYLVLHPGATAASRRYPAERFAEAAASLVECTGLHVFVTGAAAEHALASEVVDGARARLSPSARTRVLNLAGRLTLGQLGALIEHAAVLISNNSAPMHIASARLTPVVALYALTNPQHTPWLTAHRLLYHDVACCWCYKSACPLGHHECLSKVTSESVVTATLELLPAARNGATISASLPDQGAPAAQPETATPACASPSRFPRFLSTTE